MGCRPWPYSLQSSAVRLAVQRHESDSEGRVGHSQRASATPHVNAPIFSVRFFAMRASHTAFITKLSTVVTLYRSRRLPHDRSRTCHEAVLWPSLAGASLAVRTILRSEAHQAMVGPASRLVCSAAADGIVTCRAGEVGPEIEGQQRVPARGGVIWGKERPSAPRLGGAARVGPRRAAWAHLAVAKSRLVLPMLSSTTCHVTWRQSGRGWPEIHGPAT